MTKDKLQIGLFGYGCVGQGLHDVLNSSKGFRADIARICVKDPSKKRRIPMSYFTFEEISESFISNSYKYLIGIINLTSLFQLGERLKDLDVFIINTGRKGIN
ncbi:MAG TPA: hypothetical protein PLR52_03440 [Bacteroidales bacterium]|nr:hypothetical protein [Bacteroidales bacterium]HPI67947.1 hypothetical protein [Bacteroidales bacterium]